MTLNWFICVQNTGIANGREKLRSIKISLQLGVCVSNIFFYYFAYIPELNTTGGTNLPSAPPISQSTVSAQNLVMSSSGVGDGSVTLTLADTQGMLTGGLDAVTLNITSQVRNAFLNWQIK